MDAVEFTGWRIYWEINPDTLERRDYMLAQATAVHCKDPNPTKLMPWHKDEPASAQDVADKAFAIFGTCRIAAEAQEKREKRN